jgi:DNA repair protein SbcD/Mre11
MKIIHTSDWHIGRTFEHESLEGFQRDFLRWLAGRVADHRVDLVVVAGDLYDRSVPSVEAVDLLDRGIDGLRAAGAQVALISGNHDSAARLGFGARRQALGGVHVFTDDMLAPTPQLLTIGGEEIVLLPVPFLDPPTVGLPAPGPDGRARARTHGHVLADAFDAGRDALSDYPGVPTVAVAHAFVQGGTPSDSEKQLTIGGADVVDASVFRGFDYVALGHLHRPQVVGGDDRVAYSGSPLPYSFSEIAPKSVRLLVTGDAGIESVENLPVPVGRPATTVTGSLSELLESPAFDGLDDHWIRAELTDEVVKVMPKESLRRRFPHIVTLHYVNRRGGPATGAVLAGRREVRDPGEVARAFVADIRGRPVSAGEAVLLDAAVAGSAELVDV